MTISITGVILCICMYPFVLIMYALLKNEAQSGKGIYFGVTVPKEHRGHPEITAITEVYNRQMKRCLWLMLVFPLPALFLPWDSIVITVWMLWMTISIVIFFVPFGIANAKLKEVKKLQGWLGEVSKNMEAEIKSAGKIRRVKWFHHIPQCVISVILPASVLFSDFEMHRTPLLIMLITFAGITFLFWGMAVWQDRQKTQIISSDSDVNVNYNRAKKNLYKNVWVLCSWVNVAYMVWMLFCVDEWGRFTNMFWWATGVYIVGTLLPVLWMVKKKVSLDKTYETKRNRAASEDHDENWIWGMIYYNPGDRHSMVEKRVGVGSTINMATSAGKATVVFLALTMLSLPLICIWTIMLEFTPIQLVVDQEQVIGKQLRQEVVISMLSIEEAELIEELPKMSRNSGTAMENLRKGDWSVREEGKCTVFLNPQNDVFLRIETPSDCYYLSGGSDSETEMVYEAIQKWKEQVYTK